MNPFSDTLFPVVDRLSGRLGPITALIDAIVDRIAPKAIAQASCPPAGTYLCFLGGCGSCCANCSGDAKNWVRYYYAQTPGCEELFWCSNCVYC
jgi:hypothetical protein